jgi:general secretion pathway protein A
MLVGQPDLKIRLKHPGLSSFTQRIAVNFHLTALTHEETGQYIDFRLKKAGGKPGLFNPDAVELIHQASGGIPRSINILCDSAMVYGFGYELKTIGVPVIEQVIKDKGGMGLKGEMEEETSHPSEESVEGNGHMALHRLETLEVNVRKLNMQMEWQVAELERRAESYKDELLLNLKNLLIRERKRSDTLLVENHRLKKKYEALEKERGG